MKTACIFPGQGSQKLGMGKNLFECYPEIVDIADRILGYSIKDLCLRDSEQVLNNTEFTQPALFVVNALNYLEYTKNNPRPVYLAGHSLGEYNALVAAGILSFEDALRLVSIRGKLMAKAESGAMAAIIGVDRVSLEKILENQCRGVEIANYNSYLQNVISGPVDLIEECEAIFRNMDLKYKRLSVSGAFHSSFMLPIKNEFDKYLSKAKFNNPKTVVLSNFTAIPYEKSNTKNNLSMHLISPVKWVDIIEKMMADTDKIVQIGPGRVLEGLTKRIRMGQ